MQRLEVLNTAGQLIEGDRKNDYGDATESFARIATIWTAILGIAVTPAQVAACMAGVKLSRIARTPSHADSWVDLAGYAALGGELGTK